MQAARGRVPLQREILMNALTNVAPNTIDVTPEPGPLQAALNDYIDNLPYGLLGDSEVEEITHAFYCGAKSMLTTISDLKSFVVVAAEIEEYFTEGEDEEGN